MQKLNYHNMKNLLLIVLLITAAIAKAQVGIGTTTPKSTLDIPATNAATPTNSDGILIPRIDAFPITSPTVDQNGMMVFLTNDLPSKPKGFYYWDDPTTVWIGIGGGKGWDVAGNSGTNPVTNFIGTTDANDLAFRRNNLPAGKISQFNTAIGMNALTLNASGNNTAFGNSTLSANTNGNSNTAMGTTALLSNTVGNSNLALGYGAMANNTAASNNTAVGNNTLFAQNFLNGGTFYATNNTAVGESALFSNNPNSATTGKNNTALGYSALSSNSTGSNNIGIGANAQVQNATANDQLSIGNVIYGTAMSTTALGKIGIGETAPGAKLQISSATPTTPANTDGIIIPRVSTLTAAASMTAAQNGMMVFLSATFSGKSPGFYYWDSPGNAWKGVGTGTANGWGLTGNSGTNPATNFIGTTDGQDLIFKRNSVLAGKIELQQTALGFMALSANTTGYHNTAFGSSSLSANAGGRWNAAFGMGALAANINADLNSAFGFNALNKNTTGRANTAIGEQAMQENISGSRNTSLGFQTLMNNKIGEDNVALGNTSLLNNTTASKNVAIGVDALLTQSFNNGGVAFDSNNVAIGFEALNQNNPISTTDGVNNAAIGNQAMRSNTSGSDNTGIGYRALFGNTTGNHNLAIGTQALENATGWNNVGIGLWTLRNNTGIDNMAFGAGAMQGSGSGSGSRNTAIGMQALGANDSGSGNISIGYASLLNNKTGNYNTIIGDMGMTSSVAASYATAVGFHAMYYANNTAVPYDNTNTAIGSEAIMGSTIPANNTGNANTAVGYHSLTANTAGSFNAAFGNQALVVNSSGSNNVALGYNALSTVTTGSNNIAIGSGANVSNATGSNQMSIGNVIYGTNMDNLTATPANLAIGAAPNTKYRLYNYTNQITANGLGQYGIYTYRTRNSANDGTGYGAGNTNAAIAGYNYWGDMYTFGTIGYSYFDFTRCGGILGSHATGSIWSSLAYKASSGTGYAVYATTAPFTGAGRLSQQETNSGIGGGFYGGVIGSWSKGDIGQISSGNLFAAYNSGDEYTAGRQVEIVETANGKKAAYTMTSTESVVYKKGKITLANGMAHIDFDSDYAALLGDIPIVTTTPMGQCSGIYIESVDKSGFTVRELNNGTSNVTVSWIAVGDRIDAAKAVSADVLANDFDANINEVMFNENNKNASAKGIWKANNTIQFGQLPTASESKEKE
jgi:hypothetical protein